MTNIDIPETEGCAFCDYLSGRRPFTIVERFELVALLVTREQRGVAHVLAVPLKHRRTLLDVTKNESQALMALVIAAAHALDTAFAPSGIAVWQNNGVPAHQMIPHVHFHIAGTLPDGGTDFGDVPELSLDETEKIAQQLRPALEVALNKNPIAHEEHDSGRNDET